jgi:tRNA threonylcarbamoyladenosine biosynthesis protein TsaB
VAVTQGDSVLEQVVLPPGREHLENLVPIISDLLSRLHIHIRQLDGLAVATGPGSFSGIRIGIACIKGIATVLKMPVVGVSSLEIQAWQVLKEDQTGISLLDARRAETYVAGFHKKNNLLEYIFEPALIDSSEVETLISEMPDIAAIVGEPAAAGLISLLRKDLQHVIVNPSASACALIAFERLRRGQANRVHSLVPLYVRRSDAEEKRDLFRGGVSLETPQT